MAGVQALEAYANHKFAILELSDGGFVLSRLTHPKPQKAQYPLVNHYTLL